MDKKEFLKLVSKYNQGLATEEEVAFLNAYDGLFDSQEDILDQLSPADKSQLKASMHAHITGHMQTKVQQRNHAKGWKKGWLAAAVVLVSCTIGYVLYKSSYRVDVLKTVETSQKTELISPGSNQAILTLSNGDQIALNDRANGVVHKESGLLITKNEDGQLQYEMAAAAKVAINTLTTPRGGQYQLILADGTKVWLNADSKIIYPTQFGSDERKVEVLGEAYFEVAKNPGRPFKVVSKNQVIEVLGTHFNVNNYQDEAIAKTTLLEGSVKISSVVNGVVDRSSSKILQPGEQASLQPGKAGITVTNSDLESAVAWKNGYFRFNRTDMQSMMRQVARWYDVEVEYRGKMSDDLFGGSLRRSDNIQEVIRILQLSKINVVVSGKKIIISN